MKLDSFRSSPEMTLFSLTAMIDVLFLMIIFLVLGANFESSESVTLPEAHGQPTQESAARLVLRPGGLLFLEGRQISPGRVIATLKDRLPKSVLLLPDRKVQVGRLFRLYNRLESQLGIPVRVGVRPPSPQ